MTIEYAFTDDDSGVRVRVDNNEITTDPIPNPGSGRRFDNDLPVGVQDVVWEYIATDVDSDGESLEAGIKRIAVVANGEISETDAWW